MKRVYSFKETTLLKQNLEGAIGKRGLLKKQDTATVDIPSSLLSAGDYMKEKS